MQTQKIAVKKETAEKKPTQKQIAYITGLAKIAGIRINPEKIETASKASSIIKRLKMFNMQMNRQNNFSDSRDNKIAFGMATKLIFRQYLETHRDYREKGFWDDVSELYSQYRQKQEQIVNDV